VGERLRAWQRLVAHVPQSIFLADTTVEANIAFGVAFDEVDHQAVRAAAQKAQVSSFIESLPQAYDTVVGERGVRLSGGQRQRIGIARALYKRASVLVLDEATSALDNLTEQAVMNSLHQLDRELTIFVIAHRLTTVQQCDRIVELANGRAIVYSSYEEMMANHPGAKSLNDMVPQRGANT
jgi:ATP-binding cassette subfamily B protein